MLEEIESMKVQRLCKKLLLLLLIAASLCQMAFAASASFLYTSQNVSWVEMEGDDVFQIDGDTASRTRPTAAPGEWLQMRLPLRANIGADEVLQSIQVMALTPESSREASSWPFSITDFEADCVHFPSLYDWRVSALWDDDELDMTFKVPVPSSAQAGTYKLYFKITATLYDGSGNSEEVELKLAAACEVTSSTSGSTAGTADTSFAGVQPNDNDKVVSSNVHALLIADAGVSAPAVKPGENAEILMPLVVNREYLPSDLYFLRNITIEPSIPTTIKDIGNWPFDITSISYVRHLDDMTYNSRADVEYSIPVSQSAKKGVYPIDFTIWATVWRYDEMNGTDIQEDVKFTVTIYVTVTEDGSESGVTSELGALTTVSVDEDGQHIAAPRGNCGQRITFTLPLVNRGKNLTDITITPKVSSNLNEFPFVTEQVNYGQTIPDMAPGEMVMVEFDFQLSPRVTQGNKPVTFQCVYKENGAEKTCEVTSYVYVVYGYEEPNTQSAPPVHIESYSVTVDGEPVERLFAGDEAVLTMTIRNNDANVNARKVRIGASIDTKVLLFAMGETDTKYVDVIESGETAQISYKLTVANDAAEGPTNFSVTINYENWEVTQASASQTLPLSVKQPVRVEIGEPTIYDSDAKPDEPVAMSLSIVNKGRSKIYNVSIDVNGKGLSMYEDYYGGDVLPAAKLNPDILVASTTAGKCTGELIVCYEDSEGERYEEKVPVSFTVAETPIVEQPQQTDSQITTQELEQPKKTLSTGAKIGIGAAAVVTLGGVGLGIRLKKRRGKYEIS